jgi:hypothetical protein
VRDSYLRADGLPNVAWLAERERVAEPTAKRAAGGV